MKLILLLCVLPVALSGYHSSSSPSSPSRSIYTVTCTLGANDCPTGSICTQTETCRGLCLASQTLPPQIPCTVAATTGCPTGSTCTPTMTCPATGVCGGACIATAQPSPTSLARLPTQPCVVGANDCPSGSFVRVYPRMHVSTPRLLWFRYDVGRETGVVSRC